MNKVYVVIYEYTYDYDNAKEIYVFSTLENAKNKVKELIPTEDLNYGIQDVGEGYFEFYNEGCYAENHISCAIYKQEII